MKIPPYGKRNYQQLGELYHNIPKAMYCPHTRAGRRNMNDLFDLVGEYKQLYEMLTEEGDEQVITDTLEGVQGEIEIKAEGLVKLCDRLDMEIEACKKHKDEWAYREKVRKNARARINKLFEIAMIQMDVKEIKAGDITVKMQNAGGKLGLIVDPDATIPERFTKLTIEPDNELIRKALDDGEKLDFARFAPRTKVIKFK